MRRALGALFVCASVFFLHGFAAWGGFVGALERDVSPSLIPFHALGKNYPLDAAMLIGAVWTFGLGLYFLLSRGGAKSILPPHVPSTSRWAQRVAAEQASSYWMATAFLLNALLLVTVLFAGYIGANASGDNARTVSVLALIAALQVAVGLMLLILALFERPRGIPGLILGGAAYLLGTVFVVLVFVWGKPTL